MQGDNSILWLGPVVNEETMLNTNAVSPAANRWQHSLLLALQKLGVRVFVMNYIPEQVWPKGKLLMKGDSKSGPLGVEGSMAPYLNIPFWRNLNLFYNFFKVLHNLRRNLGGPSVVITYNAPLAYTLIGRYVQKKWEIPWICIAADGKPPSAADGLVFLSWGYYNRFPHHTKLHLDGGVNELKFDPVMSIKSPTLMNQIILYTGLLNHIGGADFLINSFQKVRRKDVELWLCGQWPSREVKYMVEADSRIKLWGVVSENNLIKLSNKASIFVNTRPSFIPENRNNFPSKILEYLTYGKPIITTRNEGIAPEYKDVLVILEEENVDCFARTIEKVLEWDEIHRKELSIRIEKFLYSHKMWSLQATRMINWLNS